MTYRYEGRRSRGSLFWRGASLVLLAALGVVVVLWAIGQFRERADARLTDVEAQQAAEEEAERLAQLPITATAAMLNASGVAVGILNREGTSETPSYNLVAKLGPIDQAAATYTVWMLKDGLADVAYAGDLAPRADGTWAISFAVPDPLDYPIAVITIEPNDGDDRPSGNRIAEGRFGE